MGEIRKENLHQSLIEYLDGLGLTEEQVQGLIDGGLVNTNTRVDELHTSLSNAWSTINEINARELNGQQYKLTTDQGQGFELTNQNADDCVGTGTIYFGENITNSPNCAVGTWWTIENYITADGLWGHQIATAWYDNATYIRRKINGTFDGWRRLVENSITDNLQNQLNNVQTHKLSDGSGFCKNLGSCNWDDVKTCGYYMGSNTTNAPENSADWFMVHVIAHNDIWCEQIATAFATTQKRYVRYQTNGSWTAWRSL